MMYWVLSRPLFFFLDSNHYHGGGLLVSGHCKAAPCMHQEIGYFLPIDFRAIGCPMCEQLEGIPTET